MTWSVANYNVNPNLNTSINAVDISENCAAAGYNDALRQIMADIATWTTTYAVTYPISIANGGTGQTNAAAALVALGGLAASYRNLAPVTETAAFTFADSQCSVGVNYTGAAAAATIDPHATTAVSVGGVIPLRNNGTGALTVTPGPGVSLKKNGATVSATAALAIGGVASLIQWAADDWTISGSGIS
jgi:hypothetical protein